MPLFARGNSHEDLSMAIKSLLFGALSLIILTGCSDASVIKVVIYSDEGIQTVLDQNKLRIIGNTILDFTNNIDDVLQVILTPSQIDEIINNEYGIEIQYSNKQEAYKANNPYSISFSKIYIPLSGQYSKLGIVYFFGNDEGYGSLPPYVTNKGLNELKHLVEQLKQ